MSVANAANDLGVGWSTLDKWVRMERNRRRGPNALNESDMAKLKRLEQENHELRLEREILKKAAVFFCKGFKVKAAFVKRYSSKVSIEKLCQSVGISKSGYYDYVSRKISMRDQEDVKLIPLIKKSFIESRKSYGSRRIADDLKDLLLGAVNKLSFVSLFACCKLVYRGDMLSYILLWVIILGMYVVIEIVYLIF